jgi:hypothetical protein
MQAKAQSGARAAVLEGREAWHPQTANPTITARLVEAAGSAAETGVRCRAYQLMLRALFPWPQSSA